MVKDLARVFIFLGEEEFLKEEEIDKLRKICGLDKGERTNSFHTFWAADEDFSIEKVIGLARTPSLFSRSQIILVKDAEKISPAGRELLLSYIDHPSRHSLLVLLSRTKQKSFPDPEFLARLRAKEPKLEFRDFRPLSEEEIRRRIICWVKERDKTISLGEVDFILAKAGRDLARIREAIEKACLYAKDRAKLEPTDIENAVGKDIALDVYKMLDAMLNRDISKAVQILRGLNQFNIKPDKIIGVLAKELRKFYIAKELIKEGLRQNQVQSRLGLKYYLAQFFSNLNKIKLEELENGLRKLLYIDVNIKTGKVKPFFAIESWLLDFARLRR